MTPMVLTALIAVPFIGGVASWLAGRSSDAAARWVALLSAFARCGLAPWAADAPACAWKATRRGSAKFLRERDCLTGLFPRATESSEWIHVVSSEGDRGAALGAYADRRCPNRYPAE